MGSILKNFSILRKFLFINLIIFIIIGILTIVYLNFSKPNLIYKKTSNHIAVINNTIDHIRRLKINFNKEDLRKFLFSTGFLFQSIDRVIFLDNEFNIIADTDTLDLDPRSFSQRTDQIQFEDLDNNLEEQIKSNNKKNDEQNISNIAKEYSISTEYGKPFTFTEESYNKFILSTLKNFIYEAFLEDSSIIDSAINDLIAFKQRDPAVKAYSDIMLYFKGFQAIQAYRVANWLWKHQRVNLAFYLQSLISQVFTLDIHPAAEIGSGIMLDHATGIVIGETAVLQDNISIMQGVTLGGTGNERGDRHPKINSGVLIGSNAQVIGNITVGEGAKIGSGSVVLDDIEPHTTVAGIPAVVIGKPKVDQPALDMDHILNSTE